MRQKTIVGITTTMSYFQDPIRETFYDPPEVEIDLMEDEDGVFFVSYDYRSKVAEYEASFRLVAESVKDARNQLRKAFDYCKLHIDDA